jgi:uncharacterized protein
MIPSREQCLELLEKHKVPPHIQEHIFQVTRIAMFLGKRISRKERVNLRLLEAASLLHDLDKHLTFEEVHQHGHITAEMLERLGYHELIPLIIRHRMTAITSPGLNRLEEKILYYSDMRVKHDRIESLKERIAYIKGKYGSRSPEAMKAILEAEPLVFELEKEILGKAGVSEALEGME